MDTDAAPDKDKDSEKDKEKEKEKDDAAKAPKKRGRPSLGGPKKKPPAPADDADADADSDEDHSIQDKAGDAKVSADGEMLGGRILKVRTFRLARHPTRLYVLTLDVARALGFRDSYLLHMKNPQVKRLYASDEDKQVLESMDLLASNFRNRPLGIMAIRTAFKYFGYQLFVRGKPVRDDYVCEGKVEPENWVYPEDEADQMSGAGLDLIQLLQHLEIHRQQKLIQILPRHSAPKPPTVQPPSDPRSHQNILRSAASAAEFNSRLRAQRRRGRFLDIHTNVEQVPLLSQPTHVLIEKQLGSQEKGMVLEVSFGDIKSKPASTELEDWMKVEVPDEAKAYPVALIPGQYQGAYSVHRTRFEQNVAPIKSNESYFVDYTGKPMLAAEVPQAGVVLPQQQLHQHNQQRGPNIPQQPNQPDPDCAMCHNEDPPEDEFDENPARLLLRCAECGLGHHLQCAEITTPVMVSKALAPGSKWKCGNCKMCEVCNKAGEDETLMVLCDACDKGYHTYCMNPKMDKAPSGSWHCPSCRICLSCGNTDTNMDWRHISVPPTHEDTAVTGKIEIYACTYCVSCNKRFESEQFCPLCFHVYNEEMEDIAMACCDVCDRWIHVGCDPELTESRYRKLESMNAKYTCVLCSEPGKLQQLIAKSDKGNKALGRPSKLMMYHGKYLVVPPLVKRPPEKA
ncbi:chromatin remodelling complex Rsc7/Swp82 subunit-domain-containing protein [Obelidium mucronatum]|nr:chromatin remodelling complex Rsc7/Swp82 subunit-domain-containing protein [Obelidium mucronatum]